MCCDVVGQRPCAERRGVCAAAVEPRPTVLLVVGAWMIDRLKAYSRAMACLESGHRYCAVLDPRHLPGR